MTLSVVKDDRRRIACGCLVVMVLAVMVLVIVLVSGGFSAGARFFLPMAQKDMTPAFLAFMEKQRSDGKLLLFERQSSEKIIKTVNCKYKVPSVGDLEFNDSYSLNVACPVVYHYYVGIKEGWKVVLDNNELIVDAPAPRLERPKVILTQLSHDMIEGQASGEDRMLQNVAAELSNRLYLNAMQSADFNRRREICRLALEDFVRGWLTSNKQEVKGIKIRFQEDKAAHSEETESQSALRIEKDPEDHGGAETSPGAAPGKVAPVSVR